MAKPKEKKSSILQTSPGLATAIWGPLFWALLNDVAIMEDARNEVIKQKKNGAKQTLPFYFFQHLKQILPCKYCRQSYSKFYRQDPPHSPYIKWVFELHDKVNQKLDKPLSDWSKFKRKCQVYSHFSDAYTFWDIHFMLALNYDPIKKKQFYHQWFEGLDNVLNGLVQYRKYNLAHVQSFFSIPPLSSKVGLLRWLADQYNRTFSTNHPLTFFVEKYIPSIAHNTPEELAQLCGPLLVQCARTNQKNQSRIRSKSRIRHRSHIRSKSRIKNRSRIRKSPTRHTRQSSRYSKLNKKY